MQRSSTTASASLLSPRAQLLAIFTSGSIGGWSGPKAVARVVRNFMPTSVLKAPIWTSIHHIAHSRSGMRVVQLLGMQADVCLDRATSARNRPNLAHSGSTPAELRPKLSWRRPKLPRVRAMLSNICPASTKLGPTSAKSGSISAKYGPTLTILDQQWQRDVQI